MLVEEHQDTATGLDTTETSNFNFTFETSSMKEPLSNTIFQVPKGDTNYQAVEQGEERNYLGEVTSHSSKWTKNVDFKRSIFQKHL